MNKQRIDKIPERIYLRVVCGCDECSGKLLAGMETWSEDRKSDKDIEYVLASKLEELEKQIQRLNDAIDDAPIGYGYDE